MQRRDRAFDELRPLKFHLDYLKYPDGSVLLEAGYTKVLCTITMEEKVPSFLQGQGKGWITSEYSMLPGAREPRIQRDVHKGRFSGRSFEIQRMIGRVLRASTNLTLIPDRTLWIDCDVLQADGGTRAHSINGAFVALNLAMIKYLKEGLILKWPLKEFIGSISVGLVGGEIYLDLCHDEDKEADVDLNLAMTESEHLLDIQAFAENSPYSLSVFNEMLEVGFSGIGKIITEMKNVLREKFSSLPENLRNLIPKGYI